MLTDDEVATEEGWAVCVRTDVVNITSWSTIRTFSNKTKAYEWTDEHALEQPRAVYGVFRLHMIVSATPVLVRRGGE